MKTVSLVLMALAAILAVLLPAGTASAATVYAEVDSVTTEGCSAGDMQRVHTFIEWSGGSGGYGKYEWWLSVEGGGLLHYGFNDNPALPPAMAQLTGGDHYLANDLAVGTILRVDVKLTVDSDVATDTVYYVCGNGAFWRSTTATGAPGPDMVPIPTQAVVGTFTTATPLYAVPDPDAASSYVMQAGQSLWVFGLNEAGTFYQVLLSGHTYWVPAANVGPTYDDVWNGTPLPATVVG